MLGYRAVVTLKLDTEAQFRHRLFDDRTAKEFPLSVAADGGGYLVGHILLTPGLVLGVNQTAGAIGSLA